MDNYKVNAFIFSSRYQVLRHIVYWVVHIIIFSFLFKIPDQPLLYQLILSTLWVPVYILYSYPVMYWMVPSYLLKEKYLQFSILLLVWGVAGYFLNYIFRAQVLYPVVDMIKYKISNRNPWAVNSYLSMNVMAGFCCMIVLFKFWIKKQHAWMQAEKGKVMAELQLLKAQVHPHFLFNTLNNIYSFSLENSPKTSELILKLSSLLNYILYDCKLDEVLLEKELNVMKDYIDLEKERYANKLEISLNIEGDIKDKYIAPLLLLPFLENAFKHGTSEQLEKPWLSMDLSVKKNILRCKVVNSKNENVTFSEKGIGINNVKKRLDFLYPDMHTLKIDDESNFYVVSLMVELRGNMHNLIDAKPRTSLNVV